MSYLHREVLVSYHFSDKDLSTYISSIHFSHKTNQFFVSIFNNLNKSLNTYLYDKDDLERESDFNQTFILNHYLTRAIKEMKKSINEELILLSSITDFTLLSFEGKKPSYFSEVRSAIGPVFRFNDMIEIPSMDSELISETDSFIYNGSGVEKHISSANNYLYSSSTGVCFPVTIFHELATISTNRIDPTEKFSTYFLPGSKVITGSSFFSSDVSESLRDTKIAKRLSSFEGLID